MTMVAKNTKNVYAEWQLFKITCSGYYYTR